MKIILDKNEVKKYMEAGHTLKEAAYNFQVTYNHIAKFCRENGITKKRNKICTLSEEEMWKIADGRTVAEISEITGIPKPNVNSYLTQHHIPHVLTYKSDKRIELKDMIICLSKEFSAKSIIEQLHLPHGLVYNTIQEYRCEIHDSKRK